MDAGLDSLASVEFQNMLTKEFRGVAMPSTLMTTTVDSTSRTTTVDKSRCCAPVRPPGLFPFRSDAQGRRGKMHEIQEFD
eukprot:s1905_g5.t1